MTEKLIELRAQRAQLSEKMAPLAATMKKLVDASGEAEEKEFDDAWAAFQPLEVEAKALDAKIEKAVRAETAAAASAQPVAGQPATVPAAVAEKVHPIGGMVKAFYHASGNAMLAAQWAEKNLGESHPVTKALNTSQAAAGGALVPEDFANQVIELLRPNTVVRASGPIVIPMPRGTMRMGKQTAGVTGGYGAEGSVMPAQQPTVGNIVASFKKLTVKVPISNDWLRYSSPATDGLVQNDIVLGLARTEDLGFLRGDGGADWPRGLRYIVSAANTIASNATPTLTTVDSELSQAILALEAANVPMLNPGWVFHPRIKQYLLTLKNSNGFYVYRDEMVNNGTLRGYPFRTTTQVPVNLGAGSDTEVYLVDWSQALIFDALSLSLGMSQDASYTDASGNQRNAFERDETLIRAIAEHDFHMRHDEAVACITAVKWA